MTTCDRCGRETIVLKMSWFNTDNLCLDCQAEEAAHPQYAEARAAEEAAVRRGDFNFPGVGLPPDLVKETEA
jgi:hypothetical protein